MEKGILLTFFLLIFAIEYNYGKSSIIETEKIILKNGKSHQIEPRSAGIANLPIHATLNESVIEFSFDYDIQDLNIYIENEQGEIVYDNTVSASASMILPVYIERYESGKYFIKVRFKNRFIYGEFDL
jgi:hypothetical protein